MISNFDEVEILLVEDNSNDAELTIRALSKHNLANKLHWVKDGAEALEYIYGKGAYSGRDINNLPKIIFLDLKLPKVDGLELLRELKSNENTKITPVVVMTSSKEEKDIVESYRLGSNSYIQKPVNFDNFTETVAKLGMYWMLLNKVPNKQ